MAGGEQLFEFEILEDGSLKFESDKISPANHAKAEAAASLMNKLLGGAANRQRRGKVEKTETKIQRRLEVGK